MSALRLFPSLVGLLLAVGSLPTLAAAAPLRAIVYFQGQTSPTKPLGYSLRPNGILPLAPPSPDPRREAVLEVIPLAPAPSALVSSAGLPPLPKQQELRVFGQRLLPRVALLSPGGELVLRNDDQSPVTVELVPALAGQLSLVLAPGEVRSFKLAQAGELSLLIRELSQSQATVLLPRHLATHLTLSEVGTMAVATLEVPPGRYQVRLRMAGGASWQEEVVVDDKGRELSLHATLGEDR